MESTSKFDDDLSHNKEGMKKENSGIVQSFVGLVYPNLIEEHCKCITATLSNSIRQL